ncbi:MULTISPECIES: hypothetical protein [unclassified Streptomyces]|uniref:hypothetical protein n=1 Tax=unclassified Streptomyces TaxID=2593676 RepID=UPI000BF0E7C1|nr:MULTISPECIES: hypothetical protein [unclassified Streptomyces]
MTTSPPQVNGHRRRIPVITEWQTFLPPAEEPVATPDPEPQPEPATPAVDLVAQAEADAIRTKAFADAEEQRIRAEAEAEAAKIKAAEEARKLKLANDKAEARAVEEQKARDARIAESERKRAAAERGHQDDERARQEQQQTAAAAEADVAKATKVWRKYAIAFYAVCAIVALPVQIAAFWDEDAPWLVIAPLMLEGAALVVTKGAAAAVAANRPHWHYRTVAWVFAFIAAGINLKHGLDAFDPATAFGTAFASLAGPGVWDLHEHGRIRRRDGVPTRRERRAAKKAEKNLAAAKAAQQAREEAREKARQAAMEAIEKRLAEQRAEEFPNEWKYALKLAIAKGETTVTEPIWEQTWADLHAANPGVTANSVSARNAAAKHMQRVLERDPANTPSKPASSQRVIQVKTPGKRSSYRPTPPRRKPNDTPKFHPVARALAADAKRQSNASTEEQK